MAELGTEELAVAAEGPAPSLLSLCLDAVAARLTRDSAGAGAGRTGWPGECSNGGCPVVFAEEGEGEAEDEHLGPEQVAEALPWELLHRLASRLSPAALESLHHAAHARCCSCADTTAVLGGQDGDRRGTKRSRCEDFNTSWQSLFKRRWPLSVKAGHDNVVTVDWQQQYWEKHLQECLDEAAESALLPSFCGVISELSIPEAKIMNSIYHREDTSQQYSGLTYQLSRFGCYARCLRLQGVLCAAETYELLQHCKLERLMFIRIISEPQVNGVCLLLSCHAETLISLEFIHCQLYPSVMDKICKAVLQKGSQSHGIKQFSIKSSRICETKPPTVSDGLLHFLSSGKSLHLLSLHDTKMQSSFAQMIIHTLLESSCGLQTLEISENNIAGWLSKVNKSSTSSLTLKSDISLKSLSILNLRGNNLQEVDVVDLHKILIKMPNLRDLDITGNPIMDEGIRSLIPFISWAIQKENPLLRLRMENCDLSSIGVSKLLECLTSANQPLDVLSIADNPLGSSVASVLAKFLGSHVRDLNVEDIDLGALGFQILEEALPMEVALSHINISKNRGGIRAAYFVSKLILQAPNLVSVNAAANILPPESLEVICNTLKQRKCHLERVDLTGNFHLSGDIFPAFLEFKKNGEPILVVPSNFCTHAPYDDDP